MKGTVKWFSATKGFGFLVSDEVDKDVYVHFSDIKMSGFKSLNVDQLVTFELADTPKGYAAKEVIVS